MPMLHRLAGVSALALLCACPARALDLQSSRVPGRAPGFDGFGTPITAGAITRDRADTRPIFKTVDATPGAGALPSGRRTVEQARADDRAPTPAGALTTNTLSALLGRRVYVTDHMPLGSRDITAALPAAIAALPPGGGRIRFPAAPSCYTQSAPVVITRRGIDLEGDGRLSTCIETDHQGDALTVGTGVTVQNFRARGIGFRSSVARTAGAAIRLTNTYNAAVSDISCDDNPYVCIDVQGPPKTGTDANGKATTDVAGGANAYNVKLSEIHTTGRGYVGIRVGYGNADGLCPADVVIKNPNFGAFDRAGIEIACSGGFQITDGDLILSNVNLLIKTGPGQTVLGGFVNGLALDTAVHENLLIDTTDGGSVGNIAFTALWASSGGQRTGDPGVRLKGTPGSLRSISFNGLTAINNGGHGFDLLGGAYIDVTNPQIAYNSLSRRNTASGIHVASGVSDFSFVGGRSGLGSVFTDADRQGGTQKYGVQIDPGPSDRFRLDLDLTGNLTGAISNGATGANQTITARGAPYAFMGADLGIGTNAPASPLTVVGPSLSYTDGRDGAATAQFTNGGGSTAEGIRFGAAAGSYGWMQCGKPGDANRPCYLNAAGGGVALGKPSPTPGATDGLPYIPLMSGMPTAAPPGIDGYGATVLVKDGATLKLCAFADAAWKCTAAMR